VDKTDDSGNDLWEAQPTAAGYRAALDQLFGYNALNEVTGDERGTLNGSDTGIAANQNLTETWSLDGMGNWSNYTHTGIGPNIDQDRDTNALNEIKDYNGTSAWAVPGYDAAGLSCHSQVAGYALGFNTRQLAWNASGAGGQANQIEAMAKAAYFTNPPERPRSLPVFARADDEAQSLENRVRSYLAVNCVQCHQPGGAAQGNFDARPAVSLAEANLVNGLLVRNGEDPANRWAAPHDPAHSMVLRRLKGEGVPRMPPLATHELDSNAINLLTRWISEMPPADAPGH
jgi:mono/diheme cytochrome c family protein